MEEKLNILIVGAGPTGLMAALLLRKAGLTVRILDKKEGPSLFSNACAIQPRTLEILSTLGIVDKFLERGHQIPYIKIHDGQQELGSLDLQGLDTFYPFVLSLSQAQTERLLIEELRELGTEIEWGAELIDIRNGWAKLWGGEEIVADYILGCDGANSQVREALKINFDSSSDPELFLLADLIVPKGIDPESAHMFFIAEGGLAYMPLGDSKVRFAFNIKSAPPTPMTLNWILEAIRQRIGLKVEATELNWSHLFWTHLGKARHLRNGNVFLLGDAARILSPVGGQGLNIGMQDAYNLAWKLIYVLENKADRALLDTYEEERIPVANQMLHWSYQLAHMIELSGNAAKMRNITLSYLFTQQWVLNKVKKRITHLGVNYRKGSLSDEILPNALQAAFSRTLRDFKQAPQAGDRAPDALIDLIDDSHITSLYDLLAAERFILLIFCPEEMLPSELQTLYDKLPDSVDPYLIVSRGDEIEFSDWKGGIIFDRIGTLHRKYGAYIPALYLIRPDGMIAHRSIGHDLKSAASLSLLHA